MNKKFEQRSFTRASKAAVKLGKTLEKLNKNSLIMEIDKVAHWTKQIDNLLERDKRFVLNTFPGGKKSLEGIKETIQESGKVTAGQIQAIKNIKWGRNPLKN